MSIFKVNIRWTLQQLFERLFFFFWVLKTCLFMCTLKFLNWWHQQHTSITHRFQCTIAHNATNANNSLYVLQMLQPMCLTLITYQNSQVVLWTISWHWWPSSLESKHREMRFRPSYLFLLTPLHAHSYTWGSWEQSLELAYLPKSKTAK